MMTRPTTEQITHNGQILKDVLGPVVNIMAFGAKGDGVTNDLPALQQAVTHVASLGGGTVFIPNTANGYYMVVGSCNVGGTNGVSIISDNAEIKLQGAADITIGGDNPLFGGATVSNLTVRGLRFSCTSTVLRYGNGDTDFDNEVNAGKASASVQTSFRYMMNITGACVNITVDQCWFGPGIYFGMTVKNAPAPGDIKNLRFTNLSFIGVNGQCMQASDADGIIIDNIVVDGGQDCRFDHMLYAGPDLSNVTVSNATYKNNNGLPLPFTLGTVGICLSNLHFQDVTGTCLRFGGGTANVVGSNMKFLNCGVPLGGFGSAIVGPISVAQNISLSDMLFENCSTSAFWIGLAGSGSASLTSNIAVRNFVVDSCYGCALILAGQQMVIENGVVIDSHTVGFASVYNGPGSQSLAPTTMADVTIRSIDVIYRDIACPNDGAFAFAGGDLWDVRIDNCTFRNANVSTSSSPILGTRGTVLVRECSTQGFSQPMVNPSSTTVRELVSSGVPEVTLTANSTTPSVANGTMFVTANSSATAYTNFTNGVVGQEICVRVNDANTTFDFTSTSLKGNNGVDYTATSGDVIFAKRIGSNWHCTISEA